MNAKTLLMGMTLAGFVPFCSMAIANNNIPDEEKVIALTNGNDGKVNEETLQVPVIATLTNNVLNVQFTGNVPAATVSVTNNLTGATISQQSMTALQGSVCTVPVTSGFYNVAITNQLSGESVSGDFEVEE